MYYSKLTDEDLFSKYYTNKKIGIEIWKTMENLLYPWNLLLDIDGIILVEMISDTKISTEKKDINPWKSPLLPPRKAYYYVLKGKVLNDIFGTIEEDTVFIRHNPHIPSQKIFLNNNVKILCPVKQGAPIKTINIDGKHLQNYLMGKPEEFLYVINEEIKNPYTDLTLEVVKYQEFKQNLLDFVEKDGIKP